MDLDLDFDAPRFCDFTNLEEFENADVDSYFEIDHETGVRVSSINGPDDVIAQQSQPSVATAESSCENHTTTGTEKAPHRKGPKNLVMGVFSLLAPGQRPANASPLRDVTNSTSGQVGRQRAPLKRNLALNSYDEPSPKQGRPLPAAGQSDQEMVPAAVSALREQGEPAVRRSPRLAGRAESPPPLPPRRPAHRRSTSLVEPPMAHRSRRPSTPGPAPTQTAGAQRRNGTPAATATSQRRNGTPGVPAASQRRSGTPAATATSQRRIGTPAATAPAQRRNGTPGVAAASQRRSGTPGAGAQRRGAPQTGAGGRRRSLSHNDAAGKSARLAVPETPNVLRRGMERRSAARAAVERSVQQEQEQKLAKLRKQMAEHRRKAAQAQKEPARAPVRGPMKATTVPQPFNLTAGGGTATAGAQQEFKSFVQIMEGFHRKTPERFHSSRPGSRPSSAEREPQQSHVTRGQTPPLATRSRSRPVHLPTREQLELAELEECKKHQVKAHPVNKKVLEAPVGVPPKQPKTATVLEPFNITETAPKRLPSESDEGSVGGVEFHARPVPRQILEAPQGVPERPPAVSTKPQSPAFALKQRMAERRRELQVEKESGHKIRASPLPDMGIPFRPVLETRNTRVQPFSFEERDKQRQAEKERKIQQILDEEKRQREFRAQLLPPSSPHGVPERRVQPTTKVQPFNLPGEQLSAAAAAKRQAQLEEELRQLRAAAAFHAQPCTVTQKNAFQPQPALRAPTQASSPHLHTDARAAERHQFEVQIKQHEAELEAAKEEAERRRRAEEEELASRQRREAVHRAQPIRRYRPVEVQPSETQLTRPRSPNWHPRTRGRTRSQNQSVCNVTTTSRQ